MQQDAKLALLSEAISGAIHELNQPLTMMNFVAEALRLLADKRPDTIFNDLTEIAEQVQNGARRHREILEHLRDLAQDNATARELNLNEMIERTLQMLRSKLGAKRFVVKTALDAPKPILRAPASRLGFLIFAIIFSALDGIETNGNGERKPQREIFFKTTQRKKFVEMRCAYTASVKRRSATLVAIDKTRAATLRSLAKDLDATISFSVNASRSLSVISVKFPLFSG